jgi:hypothetical protein
MSADTLEPSLGSGSVNADAGFVPVGAGVPSCLGGFRPVLTDGDRRPRRQPRLTDGSFGRLGR